MEHQTTMLSLLKERLTEDEIIKLVSNYDNKFTELERQVKIKDGYLQLIKDIAYDYDGFYNNIQGLRDLIMELYTYANQGLQNDDKTVMYIGEKDKKYNILSEEVDEDV